MIYLRYTAALIVAVLIAGVWSADRVGGAPLERSQGPSPLEQARQAVPPVVIQAGTQTHALALTTASPYFGVHFAMTSGKFPPLTVVEVDYWNNAANYFGSNPENKGPPPLGVEDREIVIPTQKTDATVNFRYATAEKNVTAAIWQISRFPFANDPAHWQDKYIPGLVASGPVKDFHVDNDGYHYFTVNFARVAGRALGDPPYYEGTATIPTPGRSGPFLFPNRTQPPAPPAAPGRRLITPFRPPAATGRRGTLPSAPPAANATRLSALDRHSDTSQRFYLRVVPMHAGNQAGIPAIPVTITVKRPHPCPTDVQTITVRPPTARIVWYMRPTFFNSSSSGGRWYVVNGAQAFLPQWLHMLDPPMKPDDKAWYETVIGTFGDIVNFFSDAMTNISMMWNGLQDLYVDLAAKYLSYVTTAGLYRCDQHPSCTGVLKSAGQAVMAAYGIPPTLPTGPELLQMSTDYLIRLGADEVGAGAALDAYQNLPDDVKQQMKSGAKAVSTGLMQQQKTAVQDAMAKSACIDIPDLMKPSAKKTYCAPRIPDPIFNAVHPATVMLYFENTNNEPTDAVTAKVTDSKGLYRIGSVVVPSLQPGEHTSVPVLLEEDTNQFLSINHGPCPTTDVVTVSGTNSCPVQRWFDRFYQLDPDHPQGTKVADTFRVVFSVMHGNAELGGLDAQSSGRQLATVFVLDAGSMCSIPGQLRYPQGWKITTSPRSVMADAWDNLFSQGPNDPGNPNNGMLRTQ